MMFMHCKSLSRVNKTGHFGTQKKCSKLVVSLLGFLMEGILWACDINNWYQNPILAKVTFPTRFVDVPERFVERLLASDGLFARTDENADFGEWSDSEWTEETVNNENGDIELTERRDKQQETFPEFEAAIKRAIDRWTISGAEGGVFPRLNWSSPLDAHWMGIGGSLRCTTVPEVLRFLEASDSVRADLEQIAAFQASDKERSWKPRLALRKWHDFHSPNEFRCFVKDNRLIAVSQKDITNFWPFLVESRASNLQNLANFFHNTIKGAMEIENCTSNNQIDLLKVYRVILPFIFLTSILYQNQR